MMTNLSIHLRLLFMLKIRILSHQFLQNLSPKMLYIFPWLMFDGQKHHTNLFPIISLAILNI